MNWVLISLLAPLFWAGSNYIDKYVLAKHTKGIFDFLFFSTVTSWIFFLIILFFTGLPQFNIYNLIPIFTGIVIIYSYGFYGKALEVSDTSTLVILFKLIPVVTALLAYLFLNQTLSSTQLIGFIIVFIGAIIVSIEKNKRILTRGLGMILIAIFIWSALTLITDFGLTKMSFWDYFLLDNLGSALAGLTLFIIPSIRRQVITGIKNATSKKYLWFSANNLLDFFGQMSFKKALAIAPAASLVSIVNQVQSIYAIIIGVILTLLVPHIIKEDISPTTLVKKLIGALIMFFGIYVLVS